MEQDLLLGAGSGFKTVVRMEVGQHDHHIRVHSKMTSAAAANLIQRQRFSQVGMVHLKCSARQTLAEPRLTQHLLDAHALLGVSQQQPLQQMPAFAGHWDVLRNGVLCGDNLPEVVSLIGIKRVPPVQQGVKHHTTRPQICFLRSSHKRVSD